MTLFQQGYGLVIGVGEYSDPAWNVPIATRDAADLYTALIDPGFAAYPVGQVELLKPEEATRAGFANALGRLAARAGEESTVFIAITCHGAPGDDNLYYLATRDVEFADDERIRKGTGFSIVELANALKAIKAQRVLLVINACFSGNLGLLASKGSLREPPGTVLPNSEGDRLLASGAGRALITASRSKQRSYFQPGESHSYFGQALIDALRGGGLSAADGTIGLYEFYAAIYRQVQRVVAARGQQQEPLLSVVDGAGAFPIARHSGAVAAEPQGPLPESALRQAPQTIYQQYGDQIDARNSQGFINRPSGPVTQVFGEQRNINTGGGSYVEDNRKLIDFGNAQIAGGVKIGDVVQGDLTKTVYNYGGGSEEAEAADPIASLRKYKGRIETLNGLPEGLRDDAVSALDRAIKAAERGEQERARRLALEAADTIDQMGHATATSIGKKVRAMAGRL